MPVHRTAPVAPSAPVAPAHLFLRHNVGTMKTLLVLRHAKSSWDDAGLDDHERPLNSRGERIGRAEATLDGHL